MDKGAHFHKCDFQTHTPRDAGWKGARAVTESEREAYAAELIQACRIRGLQAIAITDHHDFAFFPYIKTAASAEVDAIGNPIAKSDQIVVFPGLELTISSPPCQVLILLDAEFDVAKLDDILTTLAIVPVDPKDPKVPTVTPVSPSKITSLNHLEQELCQHVWLKGRFIILPNVTTSGHKTIFRDGFADHYKQMHCVGGYVDSDYSKSSDKYKNILEGRQQNNGYKPIAVFQTSDSRTRDHTSLGIPSTYVKWSEPTAEALRQACLAKESRLCLTEPQLPNVWITSVTVSNSKFLGRIDLELNEQYTAIIGGRGTGKSTILEYLRWGLCDQPIEVEYADIVQTKRKNLIDNTLQKSDGEVQVEFWLNAVPHIVKRSSKKQEILLKIGDGAFEVATEQQIRNLLPIQAYSQKQLSSVGVRIDELKRFVELPIKKELDRIKFSLRDTEVKMRSAYADVIRVNEITTELEKTGVELASLAKQLEYFRKGLKGLSEADQKVIDSKPKYEDEESLIDSLQNHLDIAEENVQTLVDSLDEYVNDDVLEIENKAVLKEIRKQYDTKFAEIKRAAEALNALFETPSLKDIQDATKAWEKLKIRFDKQYEAAKAKAQVNEQQLDQIQKVERRIAVLKRQQIEQRNALSVLGNPSITYASLRVKWGELHAEKIAAIKKQCSEFTALSNQIIKAELDGGLDTDGLTLNLKNAFAGMNIKEDKLDKVCKSIVTAIDPIAEWNMILDELESLALHSTTGPKPLPATPKLNNCGFIQSERERIAIALEWTKWLDLSVVELQFNPKFFYCTNKKMDEYIEFQDASAGQQATALLTVLLNQSGAPLIIDQPEDDIDSRMVREIVEQVWVAKSKRQLIFASHSANFVVNGDAELVVCCDYVKAGDQTQGTIKVTGAIDNSVVRDEITLVTEGGKQAFKLRMDKYGF